MDNTQWRLPKMKDLSRYKEITVDTETSGLDIWEGHRTVGVALGLVKDDGHVDCHYYPYGHDGGAQYTRGDVVSWLNTELRDKTIITHNGTFDTLMLLQDGVDLRAYGNILEDTMFSGILVNPESIYSLDFMYGHYVDAGVQKIKLPFDKSELEFVPSHMVGEYAEQDVRMTAHLNTAMRLQREKKNLNEIYRLECDCISPTVEMQNNGLIIDTLKLEKWIKEVDVKVKKLEKKFGAINPNSGKQLKVEFDRLGIHHPWNFKCEKCSEKQNRVIAWEGFAPQSCPYCHQEVQPGSPHFGKELMKRIDHPFPKSVTTLKAMSRLRDAFLIPWSKQIKKGRILPFELNQLRDRAFDGATKGTVTGRFSASMREGGAQPQQIWKVGNQIEELGDEYILRELFIPSNPNSDFLAVDASQEEFRLLAHYAKTDRIADAYNKDAFTDYHTVVAEDILKGKMPRRKAKNINFGKMYGMGRALFSRKFDVSLAEANEMYDVFEKEFPELKQTSQFYESRAKIFGEIRTLRGRLFEFSRGSKTHIALSRLIQGSAGDLMKEAMIKMYRAGLMDKLRLTVHDELVGDGHREKGKEIVELLNDVHGLRVPIRWELQCGKTWAMTDPSTVTIR